MLVKRLASELDGPHKSSPFNQRGAPLLTTSSNLSTHPNWPPSVPKIRPVRYRVALSCGAQEGA